MEADYKRTAMGYSNTGDTEGTAFGLMYELSRDYALSNNSSSSPVFNISYRHIAVDGYSERGTDAALNVGEQSLDTVTVGRGSIFSDGSVELRSDYTNVNATVGYHIQF